MSKSNRVVVRCSVLNEQVCVQTEVNDVPLAHALFDGSDAEDLASNIGKFRAQLSDKVPRELDANARLPSTHDPVWRVGIAKGGSKMLALRHPGLGWMAFTLPEAEAQSIATALAKSVGKTE